MKKTKLILLFSLVIYVFMFLTSCDYLLPPTLTVTNKSNHVQKAVLNGACIATLDPGESESREIQTGYYWIEFKKTNGKVCCSAAYFEAKAGMSYSYSCSH